MGTSHDVTSTTSQKDQDAIVADWLEAQSTGICQPTETQDFVPAIQSVDPALQQAASELTRPTTVTHLGDSGLLTTEPKLTPEMQETLDIVLAYAQNLGPVSPQLRDQATEIIKTVYASINDFHLAPYDSLPKEAQKGELPNWSVAYQLLTNHLEANGEKEYTVSDQVGALVTAYSSLPNPDQGTSDKSILDKALKALSDAIAPEANASPSALFIAVALVVLAIIILTQSSCEQVDPDNPDDPITYPNDDLFSMLDEQVAGTHNSFKNGGTGVAEWQVAHPSIAEQLDLAATGGQSVRQLELDLHMDDSGQLNVFHLPGLDEGVNCNNNSDGCTFIEYLQEIKDWSDANPGHAPIKVMVDFWDTDNPEIKGEAVESDILSVFSNSDLISSGEYGNETFAEVPLSEARGKVMFYFHDMDIGGPYTDGFTSYDGKVLFVNYTNNDVTEGFVGVVTIDPPYEEGGESQALIAQWIGAGYLVRCRADLSAEPNAEWAIKAQEFGCSWISSDFIVPQPAIDETGYTFELESGNAGQCNPLTTAEPRDGVQCTPEDIE